MNQLTHMINRLDPVAGAIKASVGDAFNLQNLAKLFVEAEKQDTISPQMANVMDYAKFIPVNNAITAVYGTSVNLQRKQGVGLGRAYAGTGMDIPLAEVVYDEVSLKTRAGSIGYQYSIMELQTALAMGVSLQNDKIAAARLAFERHMSNVAWFGEDETGLKGFYNQTGVNLTTKTLDFDKASITDILTFINGVIFDSDAIAPTDIILPVSLARSLSGRIISDHNPVTFLDYIRKNNEATLEGKHLNITTSKRGVGRGADSADRIVSYCKSPDCIEMRIPKELVFESAQKTGLDVFVPGSYLYQGVWLKRIDSMRYVDVKKA